MLRYSRSKSARADVSCIIPPRSRSTRWSTDASDVVPPACAVLELLPGEDQPLLARRDALRSWIWALTFSMESSPLH